MASSNAKRQRQAWTAERLRQQAAVTLPSPEWSPLDGVPAPEYIPEYWIGPHVGLRMVEGFRTLLLMPFPQTNTGKGFWPDYWHDWADLLAQEESDNLLKDERDAAANRARVMPSAQDITRMETVISWGARYLQPQQAKLVQYIALMRARDCELEAVAHRLRRDESDLRKTNRRALDQIATGLHHDRVKVF